MKPVVYGNIARYFGKKREEDGHTHQWTVYIKPYKNEVYYKKIKNSDYCINPKISDTPKFIIINLNIERDGVSLE